MLPLISLCFIAVFYANTFKLSLLSRVFAANKKTLETKLLPGFFH